MISSIREGVGAKATQRGAFMRVCPLASVVFPGSRGNIIVNGTMSRFNSYTSIIKFISIRNNILCRYHFIFCFPGSFVHRSNFTPYVRGLMNFIAIVTFSGSHMNRIYKIIISRSCTLPLSNRPFNNYSFNNLTSLRNRSRSWGYGGGGHFIFRVSIFLVFAERDGHVWIGGAGLLSVSFAPPHFGCCWRGVLFLLFRILSRSVTGRQGEF